VTKLKIARYEVTDALQRHFGRSDERLNVQKIRDMTGLDTRAVENALRVLYQQKIIKGIRPAEFQYPTEVTGIS
jgi:predicted transcriptional regulator